MDDSIDRDGFKINHYSARAHYAGTEYAEPGRYVHIEGGAEEGEFDNLVSKSAGGSQLDS